MMMLTAVNPTQPDYVALAMVVVLAVIVAAAALRKRSKKKAGKIPEAQPLTQPQAAPGSAGQLKLYNVEPKTAAMLMAIVAHKMGRPLNELRFISIREVTEENGYSL